MGRFALFFLFCLASLAHAESELGTASADDAKVTVFVQGDTSYRSDGLVLVREGDYVRGSDGSYEPLPEAFRAPWRDGVFEMPKEPAPNNANVNYGLTNVENSYMMGLGNSAADPIYGREVSSPVSSLSADTLPSATMGFGPPPFGPTVEELFSSPPPNNEASVQALFDWGGSDFTYKEEAPAKPRRKFTR